MPNVGSEFSEATQRPLPSHPAASLAGAGTDGVGGAAARQFRLTGRAICPVGIAARVRNPELGPCPVSFASS